MLNDKEMREATQLEMIHIYILCFQAGYADVNQPDGMNLQLQYKNAVTLYMRHVSTCIDIYSTTLIGQPVMGEH